MQIDAPINFSKTKSLRKWDTHLRLKKTKNGEFVRLIETNQTLQVIQQIMIDLFSFQFFGTKTGIPFLSFLEVMKVSCDGTLSHFLNLLTFLPITNQNFIGICFLIISSLFLN